MADKATIASIVQNNGGSITSEKLIEILMNDYHLDDALAFDTVEDFKNCRLVKFENNTFSFV